MCRIKIILPVLLAFASVFCCLGGTPRTVVLTYPGTKDKVPYGGKYSAAEIRIPTVYPARKNEFRGIWVATVQQIDFLYHTTADSYRKDYRKILKNLKAAGFTDIFFQVRPMNDAFYPSAISPWSRWMTGTEGKTFTDEPAFDPLAFMVAETHRSGLKFHAWLNPYRVANGVKGGKAKYLSGLDPKNFARQRPTLVLEQPAGGNTCNLILNPGEPEVMNYLYRVIGEIVQQYDVDGIHMDDYFYPYSDIGTADADTWKKYGNGMALADWRRNNVDTMIRNIHNLLKNYNEKHEKNVRFGVSPFGIWANGKPSDEALKQSKKNNKPILYRDEGSMTGGSQSYFKQYADTRKWVKEGWLDYIAPQLYWGFSHTIAAYAALTDWWVETVKGTDVDLYIGQGIYRQGSTADWADPDEQVNQLLYNSQYPEIDGSIFFSYIRIFAPEKKVQKKAAEKIIEKLWKKKYKGALKK